MHNLDQIDFCKNIKDGQQRIQTDVCSCFR